jgi:hypothetical protein
VYDYDEATYRTGSRNALRYQTWYNYGGILEWTWMQFIDSDSTDTGNKPIYYNSFDTVTIQILGDEVAPTAPSNVNLQLINALIR